MIHLFFTPPLRDASHFQLKARAGARPPERIVFVTHAALGVRVPAFVQEGWCSRAHTPTSCCVNPAPPVAQSGTALAIHTSSVGSSLFGPSEPSCISHTPSQHTMEGKGGQPLPVV